MNRLRLAIILSLLVLIGLGLGGYLRFETRKIANGCIDWRQFINACSDPVWIGLAAVLPETPPIRLAPGERIPGDFLRVLAQSASDHVVCRDPGQPGMVTAMFDAATPMPGCRKPS